MAIDSIKLCQLHLVVQTVRCLGKRQTVHAFLNCLQRARGAFQPDKYGFYEPIKAVINWSTILEEIESLYSERGESVLFRCESPVPGMLSFESRRHSLQWFNGLLGCWDYAKALPHISEALALLDETVSLFDADYAAVGVGGGKWNRIDMQNPEANVGSINGIRIPAIGICGIRWIASICWINVFGPKYIEFFGADTLASLPCYKSELLNDGKHFRFQVTERPEEMFTDYGLMLVQEIKNRLGHPHAFLGNPINKSDGPLPPHRLQFDTPEFDFSDIRTPLKQR